jgi:hypothetical protein
MTTTDPDTPQASGFVDANCPRCRRRIGWASRYLGQVAAGGKDLDRPPCPGCGHHPHPDQVSPEVAAKIAEAEEELEARRRDCKHLHTAASTKGGRTCVGCGLHFPGAHADERGNLTG